jgi:WD40 repeat protein
MNTVKRYRLWFLFALWLISAAAILWFVPPVPKLDVVGRPGGFTGNGKVFVILQDDGKARFFNTDTGEEIPADRRKQLAGKLSGLDSPCTPDGRAWVHLQVGEADAATLTLWQIAETKKLATLELVTLDPRRGENRPFLISPDGTTLFYVNRQRQLVLCDIATGQTRPPITLRGTHCFPMAFSPGGATIATASSSKSAPELKGIKLWDTETGKEVKRIAGHHSPQYLISLSFWPDGTRLASGCGGRHAPGRLAEVKIWDVASGEEQIALEAPESAHRLRFGPLGKTLMVSSNVMGLSESCLLWDVSQTPPRALFDGARVSRHGSAISPDGKWFARTQYGQTQIVSLPDSEPRSRLSTNRAILPAFSPDATRLAVISRGDDRPTINVIDAATGKRICGAWRLPLGKVEELDFAPDGNTLMTGS